MPDIVECQFLPPGSAAHQPQPMPADFRPTLTDFGHTVVCQHANGQFVNMGFTKSGNAAQDCLLAESLREQVWWTLEAARLGYLDAMGRA